MKNKKATPAKSKKATPAKAKKPIQIPVISIRQEHAFQKGTFTYWINVSSESERDSKVWYAINPSDATNLIESHKFYVESSNYFDNSNRDSYTVYVFDSSCIK
jgi:hypothetical protein